MERELLLLLVLVLVVEVVALLFLIYFTCFCPLVSYDRRLSCTHPHIHSSFSSPLFLQPGSRHARPCRLLPPPLLLVFEIFSFIDNRKPSLSLFLSLSLSFPFSFSSFSTRPPPLLWCSPSPSLFRHFPLSTRSSSRHRAQSSVPSKPPFPCYMIIIHFPPPVSPSLLCTSRVSSISRCVRRCRSCRCCCCCCPSSRFA